MEALSGCPDRVDVTYNGGFVYSYSYEKSTRERVLNINRQPKKGVLSSFDHAVSPDVIEHAMFPYLNNFNPFLRVSSRYKRYVVNKSQQAFEHGRFRQAYSSPYFYKMAELELEKCLLGITGNSAMVINKPIADNPQLFLKLVFSCSSPEDEDFEHGHPVAFGKHCLKILDITTREEQTAGNRYFECLNRDFKIHRGIVFCVSFDKYDACFLEMYNIAGRHWEQPIALPYAGFQRSLFKGVDHLLACSGDIVYVMFRPPTLLEINYLRKTTKNLKGFSHHEFEVPPAISGNPKSLSFKRLSITGNHIITSLEINEEFGSTIYEAAFIFNISNNVKKLKKWMRPTETITYAVYDKLFIIGSNGQITFHDGTDSQDFRKLFTIVHCGQVKHLKTIDDTLYVLAEGQIVYEIGKGSITALRNCEYKEVVVERGYKTFDIIPKDNVKDLHEYNIKINASKILGKIGNFFIFVREDDNRVVVTTLDNAKKRLKE